MYDAEYDSDEDIVGDDRISRQMRDFIEPVEEGEVWGNATYQPPEEDEHLMTERLGGNKFKPPQAHKPSSLKRLAEKNMRKKRRAMLQESRRWYMNQQMLRKQQLPASLKTQQPTTPARSGRGRPVAAYLPTASPTPTPGKYGSMRHVLSQAYQNGSHFYDLAAHLRGTGSKNAPNRDMDCASQSSGGSERRQKRMLETIVHDSE
ncbi:hypothetical protein BDU57DRAFT_532059 [Ampelomyces quisqualis]|uniref:Uncharacterized protein n=1 Tax=Ampelomyces quisqualis TaxID=50730 RepID=A0A6A5QC61_AMPQU|nr:hypothetical protein BDU57DRAFT_532059 [Ampelomyces quisqualis]